MLPVKNIIISGVISSSVLTVEDYYYAVEVEEMQIDFVFKAKWNEKIGCVKTQNYVSLQRFDVRPQHTIFLLALHVRREFQ